MPVISTSFAAFVIVAGSACVGPSPRSSATDSVHASEIFYTVTAEIALSRHEGRVAALEYTAATESNRDPRLLRRAAEVTANCLQPSLTDLVATRWIAAESQSVDAHRAAAHALLDLDHVAASAAEYRAVVNISAKGAAAELAALETEFAADDNVYGARRVADQLAKAFPTSSAARRLQAFAALRADDPASAVTAFEAALAATPQPEASERRELTEGLWRARILAGDDQAALAEAQAAAQAQGTAESRLTYALLLLAAQDDAGAKAQLTLLTENSDARPVALRLLGLVDFEHGRLDDAGVRFMELVNTGRFLDDAVYYLGLIAERHHDFERALGLYAQVQSGDEAVPALLRAAAIMEAHGAAPAGEELLNRLIEEEPSRAPQIIVAHARLVADRDLQPQALALLKGAELDYPDSTELPYALASLADDAGQTRVALEILRNLAALRPSDPAALNAYGYTLADHHLRLGEAHQLIERAYLQAPKSPAFLDSLGWVLFRQGHAEEALPYLDAAYAGERDGDIAAHLGEVLWHLNRREDAENIWSKALGLDADNRLLKATLQRLHQAK